MRLFFCTMRDKKDNNICYLYEYKSRKGEKSKLASIRLPFLVYIVVLSAVMNILCILCNRCYTIQPLRHCFYVLGNVSWMLDSINLSLHFAWPPSIMRCFLLLTPAYLLFIYFHLLLLRACIFRALGRMPANRFISQFCNHDKGNVHVSQC